MSVLSANLSRSERTWSATAEVGPIELSPDGQVGSWRITARGPNWTTDAEYRSLLWDDMVIADFARPAWKRLALRNCGLRRLHPDRHGFSLSRGQLALRPVFLLSRDPAADLRGGCRPCGELAGGCSECRRPGFRRHSPRSRSSPSCCSGRVVSCLLDYMMDDWIFGHEVVHRSRPGFDARLEGFCAGTRRGPARGRLRRGGICRPQPGLRAQDRRGRPCAAARTGFRQGRRRR